MFPRPRLLWWSSFSFLVCSAHPCVLRVACCVLVFALLLHAEAQNAPWHMGRARVLAHSKRLCVGTAAKPKCGFGHSWSASVDTLMGLFWRALQPEQVASKQGLDKSQSEPRRCAGRELFLVGAHLTSTEPLLFDARSVHVHVQKTTWQLLKKGQSMLRILNQTRSHEHGWVDEQNLASLGSRTARFLLSVSQCAKSVVHYISACGFFSSRWTVSLCWGIRSDIFVFTCMAQFSIVITCMYVRRRAWFSCAWQNVRWNI